MLRGLHMQLNRRTRRPAQPSESKSAQAIACPQELTSRIDRKTTWKLEIELHDGTDTPISFGANGEAAGRYVAGLTRLPSSQRIDEHRDFQRFARVASTIYHFYAPIRPRTGHLKQ
jgi:hypothetical protein